MQRQEGVDIHSLECYFDFLLEKGGEDKKRKKKKKKGKDIGKKTHLRRSCLNGKTRKG